MTLGHVLDIAGRIHKITTIAEGPACKTQDRLLFATRQYQRLIPSGFGARAVAA